MRWKYETWRQRAIRCGNWHKWFAWHPVYSEDGDAYWLEYVQRKEIINIFGWVYQYRGIR